MLIGWFQNIFIPIFLFSLYPQTNLLLQSVTLFLTTLLKILFERRKYYEQSATKTKNYLTRPQNTNIEKLSRTSKNIVDWFQSIKLLQFLYSVVTKL